MWKNTLVVFISLAFAAILPVFTSTAQAGFDFNLLAGSSTLDDSFFEDSRNPAIGFMSTMGSKSGPVSLAIDFIYVDGYDEIKQEWDVGLRKIFRGRRFDAYLGGGVAAILAKRELHWKHSCHVVCTGYPCFPYLDCEYEDATIDLGITPGGWAGVGAYVKAWRFNFGIDARYTIAPAKFDGFSGPGDYVLEPQDVKLGGLTVSLIIGIRLGPR